jgi:uncharacterized protein
MLSRTARGRPAQIVTYETHISWVFVVGDRAFKLKKPVVLQFLDYGTAARRREMCAAEVTLGRRLAPHLYRGVRAIIVRSGGELALAGAEDPRAVDYLVEMSAFAPDATLAAAIEAAAVPRSLPERLGARLASFHAACPARPCEGAAARARKEIEDNLDELRALAPASLLDRCARFLDVAIAARTSELDERGRCGRLREGHGDLRAEHVLLAPELAVIDCLEFDPALRTVDTADELGFLAMDLLRLGAEPLAREIIGAYRDAGGDCGTDGLIWMFAVHRALVRAKVEMLRAPQLGAAGAVPDPARSLWRVADRCAWRARSIEVLVICGGPATGKSTLARALGERFEVPCLNTDIVRKDLLGLAPTQRAGADAYTPAMDLRTYRELGARTRALLAAHSTVIVDGTFRHADERTAFTDALGADERSTVLVQCCVPLEVARQRARERAADPSSVSDATEAVVLEHGAPRGPVTSARSGTQIMLQTDHDPAEVEADLDAVLDLRLGG